MARSSGRTNRRQPSRRARRSSAQRRWLWLGALLVAALLFLFLASPLRLLQWLLAIPLRAFGLGAPVALLGVGLVAWRSWVAWRRRRLGFATWNLWLAGLLLWLGLAGLGALWRPRGLSLGVVSLYDVSAGGLLGLLVSGGEGLTGLLRAGVLAALGVIFLWPRGALRGGRWSLRRLRTLPAPARRPARRPPPASAAHPVVSERPEPEAEAAPPEGESEAPEAAFAPETKEMRAGAEPGNGYFPPMELLERAPEMEFSQADNMRRARLIEETLANHGVDAKVVEINQGPTVTQFGIEPGWSVRTRRVMERDAEGRIRYDGNGQPLQHLEEVSRTRVKVRRITVLVNDLALALAATSIRIEAPVPGKSVVGIEVPNVTTSLVTVRSVIETSAFQRLRARSKLAIALGKSVEGMAVVADLSRMPHLLIAGATGSGKSVCINSIITCLLMHANPQEVRFLMIDPKRVELVSYNGIPHLLTPVVVDVDRVVGVLRWVAREMDDRYRRLEAASARNIQAYNKSPRASRPMPYIVVIIDELADLMMMAPYEVERTICRLAQLARATGIHLIIATQRPSVDVVTGLIKANFPSRIAFAVASQVDSRTILDAAGAEKLLGRGDMLYMATEAQKPVRLQGTFVSDAEIDRVTQFWRTSPWAAIAPSPFQQDIEESVAHLATEEDDGQDALLDKARELAKQYKRLSTSLLQRRLHIGYVRAARLMDALEGEGIVGPGEPGKSREVRERDQDAY